MSYLDTVKATRHETKKRSMHGTKLRDKKLTWMRTKSQTLLFGVLSRMSGRPAVEQHTKIGENAGDETPMREAGGTEANPAGFQPPGPRSSPVVLRPAIDASLSAAV